MKKLLAAFVLIVSIILLFVTLAVTLMVLSKDVLADEWRTADTYREAAYLTAHALDWAQTHTIAANPDKFFERNPIIGRNPHSARVNRYFAITALIHYGVAKFLPHGWRENFQYVSIGIEGGQVVKNYMINIYISI